MAVGTDNCLREDVPVQVAAYLDGQLDSSATTQFETHLETCSACRTELAVQRQFLCELDSVLAAPEGPPIPKNFARVVSTRAESDMRGVRNRSERQRALLVCLGLGVTAFALLGATAGSTILASVRLITNQVFGILGFVWSTLHDFFIGVRVVARIFQLQSPVMSLLALMLLAIAIASLSHLIISYHRRGQMRLFE